MYQSDSSEKESDLHDRPMKIEDIDRQDIEQWSLPALYFLLSVHSAHVPRSPTLIQPKREIMNLSCASSTKRRTRPCYLSPIPQHEVHIYNDAYCNQGDQNSHEEVQT